LALEKSPVKKMQFPKMKQVSKASVDLLKEVAGSKRSRGRSRDERPDDDEEEDDDEGQKRLRNDSGSESDGEEETKEPKETKYQPEEGFLEEEELLRKWKTLANPPTLKMAAMSDKKWTPCRCDNDYESKPKESYGWEGAAVLKHGSLIKFGCLEFVFCVNSFADK